MILGSRTTWIVDELNLSVLKMVIVKANADI